MNRFSQLPIKRKLNLVVGISCLAVLVPMCAALVLYQDFDLRGKLVRDTTVLADVLARNSQASLAFQDEDGARKVLVAAEAEPVIVGASLYNAHGDPFTEFTRSGIKVDFPTRAPAIESRFEPDRLIVTRPVILNGKLIGTIYIRAGLKGIHDQLLWSMEIGFPVVAICVLAALVLSSGLQRSISDPILALTETAKVVAERHDYTVRAAPLGRHEIGLLTEAFNLMLSQIEEQNQTLSYERELLDTLLSNLPDAIYFKDRESRYVRVSKSKLEEAFGNSLARHRAAQLDGKVQELPGHLSALEQFAGHIKGKSDAEFVAQEDARRFREEEQEIIRTGQPVIGKLEQVSLADGSVAWLMSNKMPWRDKNGNIIGTFGSSKDVTAIKEIEQRLQTQLERLKLLEQITRAIGERQDLHSIFQVIIGRLEENLPVDFACVCTRDAAANALTVTCLGTRSEALGRTMGLTENAPIEIDQNGLARCLRGQLVYEPDTSQAHFSFPQRLAAGGLRSVVFAPLQVESQIFGILMTARHQPQDFSSADCEFLKQLSEHAALATHQAQLYSALQGAFEDLRQTQQTVMQQERLRALGQMASGIAHDINNAISPVSLYTESLLETEPNLSARSRDYLQTIQRAIEDVAHTVTRMREFSRPREPQLEATFVQINTMVQQVIDLSRARWSNIPQERGLVIDMVTELVPDLPAFMAVESEIREALVNLIFNAADAMPDGGTLTLRTKVTRDLTNRRRIAVEVCDTGIGMSEETRRHCLEPFFTTKGERGTGLGLAMVYGIVQRHGGKIEIESAVGKGTTFRLLFPAAATTAEPSKPATEAVVPTRQRLLVVDDDPLLIRSLRDILENDGHVVVSAHGGKEGIETFRAACGGRDAFALVFTDLGMPGLDGRQVAVSVKEASPSTPVVLLTGWGERLRAEGDVPPHVDEVLSKPPKLRDLRQAMARCLSRKESVQTND